MNKILLNLAVCFFVTLIGSGQSVLAASKEDAYSLRVKAGASTAVRLANAGIGSKLQLVVTTDSPLQLQVLDEQNYSRYPRIHSALFSGQVDKNLAFGVTPPASGNYYLVLRNTAADAKNANVEVSLKVEPATPAPIENHALQASMDAITDSLARLFIYEAIHIQPASCGFANLLAVDRKIYLCLEYVQALRDATEQAQDAKNLLLFGLLHEISHLLMQQWQMPFYGNEELADHLATVLAGMIGRADAATEQAEFFTRHSAAAKESGSDVLTHPLAASRAANIERWSGAGSAHIAAWMPFLLPHMQTNFLRQLEQRPPAWTNPGEVTAELKQR